MSSLSRISGWACLLGCLLLVVPGCGGDADEAAGPDSTAQSPERASAAQTSPDMPPTPVDSLSRAQRQRLGPALRRVLTGDTTATGHVEAVGTRDGETIFSVIIRSENAAALRQAGIPLTSVTGSMITARLTVDEILKAASVEAVHSVRSDRKLEPHSPSAPKSRSGSQTTSNPEVPSSREESPSGSNSASSGGGSSS